MSKLMVKNKILITRFIFIAIFIFCSHMAFADDTGIVEFLNKIDSKMHLPVREGLEKIKFDINLVYYIGNSSKSGESIGKRPILIAKAIFDWDKFGEYTLTMKEINKVDSYDYDSKTKKAERKLTLAMEFEKEIKPMLLRVCLVAIMKSRCDFYKEYKLNFFKVDKGYLLRGKPKSTDSEISQMDFVVNKKHLIESIVSRYKNGVRKELKIKYTKKNGKYLINDTELQHLDSNGKLIFKSNECVKYSKLRGFWVISRSDVIITDINSNRKEKREYTISNIKIN